MKRAGGGRPWQKGVGERAGGGGGGQRGSWVKRAGGGGRPRQKDVGERAGGGGGGGVREGHGREGPGGGGGRGSAMDERAVGEREGNDSMALRLSLTRRKWRLGQ